MAYIEPIEFITKKSKKILLRCVNESEATRLRNCATEIATTSPHIYHYPEEFAKITEEEQRKYISRHNQNEDALLIIAEYEEKIVGVFNFSAYSFQKTKHRSSLGIMIRKEFQREGIAKKLILVALDRIRSMPEIKFVELDVMVTNLNAIELYKKMGFKIITTLPKAFQLYDGTYIDEFKMRLEIK